MNNEKNDQTLFPLGTLLPKKLAGTEEGRKILSVLNRNLVSIFPGKDYMFPTFPMSQPIVDILYSARRTGRLIRGLEDAGKKLNAERAGILNIDIKTGSERNERISRLANGPSA